MLEAIGQFILNYKYIFIFYGLILLLVYVYRSKVDIYGKFIVMYRMKLGLKFMDKIANKYREWVILWGYIGVGVGFLGMLFIAYMLLQNLWDIFFVEGAVSGVQPVLPGIEVPGLGILPFWHWIVAIFLIAVIHEFSHGVVARAHNIPVKNTGLLLMGPVFGAFVEPDEKKMPKEQDVKQYSVLAAGSWSNILLAVVALLLLQFAAIPAQESMVTLNGFTFEEYVGENNPIEQAGIEPGTRITGINGQTVTMWPEFAQDLQRAKPGEELTIATEHGDHTITLAQSPDNPKQGFLGITGIKNEYVVNEQWANGFGNALFVGLEILVEFLRWLFLLSLGIGLFNLLPLPIVDGGRMFQVFMWKWKGVKKGDKYYHRVSWFLFIVLAVLLVPWVMGLF